MTRGCYSTVMADSISSGRYVHIRDRNICLAGFLRIGRVLSSRRHVLFFCILVAVRG